jgi:hypothetical protein
MIKAFFDGACEPQNPGGNMGIGAITSCSLAIVGFFQANFARVLLCHRCGISALNFNRRTVFLIFFCGWAKINLFENQRFT